MGLKNLDIRAAAKENGICLWQIAFKLGISDNWFSRKLRQELPEAEKEKIFKIIDELKG